MNSNCDRMRERQNDKHCCRRYFWRLLIRIIRIERWIRRENETSEWKNRDRNRSERLKLRNTLGIDTFPFASLFCTNKLIKLCRRLSMFGQLRNPLRNWRKEVDSICMWTLSHVIERLRKVAKNRICAMNEYGMKTKYTQIYRYYYYSIAIQTIFIHFVKGSR